MPPKTQQKTKEQKMAAAMAGGKGKGKKKWSKGKVREKVANKVLYDQETYERLLNEVPKMKLITASAIVERLKVNAALARASIHELEESGVITKVLAHHAQYIYTRAVGGADE
ncbi:S25 ribosomal protein, partial [Globisporangium splendens]|uniref:40S ribosomal protein S25 n=1 Tax=Globisporangium ultimum (strain ATCC 200006 / CBS 805.95 / DAOM BR144) TaxID=431595 RepID=K3X818_GLOUD